METSHSQLSFEIELRPGEKLSLPQPLVDAVGSGRWRITVEPANSAVTLTPRDHSAFLNSYAAEDEGLYDDYSAR